MFIYGYVQQSREILKCGDMLKPEFVFEWDERRANRSTEVGFGGMCPADKLSLEFGTEVSYLVGMKKAGLIITRL